MKRLILIALFALTAITLKAQELSFETPVHTENNIRYELIECTDFDTLILVQFLNGERVEQEGYYRNGKTDGLWKMYSTHDNSNGVITSTMLFKMGKKVRLDLIKEDETITIFYENERPIKQMTIAYLD